MTTDKYKSFKQHTMPEVKHICASSWQNPRATLSCTFREKFMQIQLLTVPPLTIFYSKTYQYFLLRINTKVIQYTDNSNFRKYLIHHIPLSNLGQAILFSACIMIFQLHNTKSIQYNNNIEAHKGGRRKLKEQLLKGYKYNTHGAGRMRASTEASFSLILIPNSFA